MLYTAKKKRTFPRRMIPFCVGLCVGIATAILCIAVVWYVCANG